MTIRTQMCRPITVAGTFLFTFVVGSFAWAHCDQMGGPVVVDAQYALEKGDVARVLKWIPREDEHEIREAFKKTLVVRGQSSEAMELADRFFFETLVRVHRASEGVAFTSLKPADTPISAGITKADQAIEEGNVDQMATQAGQAVEESIRQQFERTMKSKAQKDQSVEAGREYVADYVPFIHYVKNIHELIDAGPQVHKHAGPKITHETSAANANHRQESQP